MNNIQNATRREQLQADLEKLSSCLKGVYFQPPRNIKMKYPCIVYGIDGDSVFHADDISYKIHKKYTITIIDPNPDSIIPDQLCQNFKYCKFDRAYQMDNLNHYVFTLYY